MSKRLFLAAAAAALFTAISISSASVQAAESACKGLAQAKCVADANCSWVKGYKTEKGKNVAAYCRSKGKGSHAKSKAKGAEKSADEKADAAKKKASTKKKPAKAPAKPKTEKTN